MKKIIIIISSIIFLLCAVLTIYPNFNSDKKILKNSINQNNKIVNSNSLTMMYETEAGSGEYQISNDNTWPVDGYIFNETLSKCENGSKLTWDDENKKVIMQTNTSDKCYVYFDKKPITLANYIINNIYTGTDGDNGLYYHDGTGSYANADQEAGDNSYRYAGANPNNYVCFGSDAEVCPYNNLYRIIGVFDGHIKLILNYDFTHTSWSGSTQINSKVPNTWSTSALNTESLNGRFLASLESLNNYISVTDWQVGTLNNVINTPKSAYDYELGAYRNNLIYKAKIGLIYISDYGYAASPENWKKSLKYVDGINDYSSEQTISNNWLHMSDSMWTITPTGTNSAYYIYNTGGHTGELTSYSVYPSMGLGHSGLLAAYPVFYLNIDVAFKGGMGTENDPYRLLV